MSLHSMTSLNRRKQKLELLLVRIGVRRTTVLITMVATTVSHQLSRSLLMMAATMSMRNWTIWVNWFTIWTWRKVNMLTSRLNSEEGQSKKMSLTMHSTSIKVWYFLLLFYWTMSHRKVCTHFQLLFATGLHPSQPTRFHHSMFAMCIWCNFCCTSLLIEKLTIPISSKFWCHMWCEIKCHYCICLIL